MSNGKNIEIRIAATGGDQAAEEVRKVEAAVTTETLTLNKLEAELREATAAYKAAEVGSEQFVAASKRLENAKKTLTDATGKVTKSGVQMGTGFQNVGFQVQDLAVQIGAGTSALTALGQQAPQLLSGFGPLGITLGTVAAVALPLAGALFKLGDAAEDAGGKADAAADKLEKLNEKRAAKAALTADKDLQSFLGALEDETIAYQRQNAAIQRQFDLLVAIQSIKSNTRDAEVELEISKVKNSDAPESKKIAQIAKIEEAREAEKLQERGEAGRNAVTAAQNVAIGATGAVTLEQSKRDTTAQNLRDKETEATGLQARIGRAAQAKISLAALEKDLKFLKLEEKRIDSIYGPLEEKKRLPTIRAAITSKEAQKKQLENQDLIDLPSVQRLKTLKGEDGKGGEIADLKKLINDQTLAITQLEEKARTAQDDFKITEQIETAKFQGDRVATGFRVTEKRGDTDAAIKAAQAREKDERDKKTADDSRKKLGDDLSSRQSKLDSTSRERGVAIRDFGNRNDNATAQSVGKALADGTNAAEIERLGDQVREAVGKNGVVMTSALQAVLAALNTQAKEIATLKHQIKNR